MKYLSSADLDRLTLAWKEWVDGSQTECQRRSRGRLYLVFLLIRFGSLRLSEALALNDKTDLDYSTYTVKIRGTRAREVQIPEKAMHTITSLVDSPAMYGIRGTITRLDQGYVRKRFYVFAEKCGLDKTLVSPQVIRDSRGAELLRGNVPLNIVQKFLGQRSPVLAANFVSFSDEDARRIVHHHLRQEAMKRTSARNAFTGSVTKLVTDNVSAMVEITTLGNLTVTSLITIESVQRLGIHESQVLTATIKAPYVMIVPVDALKLPDVNSFEGTITDINRGDIQASVVVDIDQETTLCTVMAREELEEMHLDKGKRVHVFFSTFSVVLTLPDNE